MILGSTPLGAVPFSGALAAPVGGGGGTEVDGACLMGSDIDIAGAAGSMTQVGAAVLAGDLDIPTASGNMVSSGAAVLAGDLDFPTASGSMDQSGAAVLAGDLDIAPAGSMDQTGAAALSSDLDFARAAGDTDTTGSAALSCDLDISWVLSGTVDNVGAAVLGNTLDINPAGTVELPAAETEGMDINFITRTFIARTMKAAASLNYIVRSTWDRADIDARAYLTRANVTSFNGQKEVINFVKGLKAAGFWSILDDAWLFKSTHNAGTGTTLFALKENARNLTMTGSNGWQTDGVRFSAGLAAAGLFRVPIDPTQVVVGKASNTGLTWSAFVGGTALVPDAGVSRSLSVDDSGDYLIASQINNASSGDIANAFLQSTDPIPSPTTMTVYSVSPNNATASSMFINGAAIGATDVDMASYGTAQRSLSNNMPRAVDDCTLSLTMCFRRAMTSGEHATLYTLIKTTVGQGLGLP